MSTIQVNMLKLKTWEEKTLRKIRKMPSQVERNLEQEDVQASANKDAALIRITSTGLADPDGDTKN